MGFLGIGAMEALVIVVIALIIFGPGRLPEIMGEAGRTVRELRKATRELTGDFEDSISEVRGTYRELESEMRQTATGLRKDIQSVADDVNSTVANASNLDDAKTATPGARGRQPKLDQIAEPTASGTNKAVNYATPGKISDETSANRALATQRSPNGVAEPVDDLLSASDGDDLLSMDESD
jgi:TatA/E family protein of Tat protein translocase